MGRKRASSKVGSREGSLTASEFVVFTPDLDAAIQSDPEASSPKAGRPRRPQVANACENCRTAKVKCSGKHPACSRCQERGLDCTYDVAEEGITRGQHLRRLLQDQTRKVEHMSAILFMMRTGSDQDASELLARLRMGESVENLIRSLQSAGRLPPVIPAESLYENSNTPYSDSSRYLHGSSFSAPAAEPPPHVVTGDGALPPHDDRVNEGQEWEKSDPLVLDPQLARLDPSTQPVVLPSDESIPD